MTLEQEAEKYSKKEWGCENMVVNPNLLNATYIGISFKDFIAGASSTWVEIEKIKYAISVLNKFTDEYGWFQAIQDLEKELKQIEQQ